MFVFVTAKVRAANGAKEHARQTSLSSWRVINANCVCPSGREFMGLKPPWVSLYQEYV